MDTNDRPHLDASFQRIVTAAERLAADRLRLLAFDVSALSGPLPRVTGDFLLGTLLGILGWVALLASLTVALAPWVPIALTLLVLAIGHGLVARRCFRRGRQAAAAFGSALSNLRVDVSLHPADEAQTDPRIAGLERADA